MARILVTGMSGVGKSTVLDMLAERGIRTVDTDYDDWLLATGGWDEHRMRLLLETDEPLVVSGAVENQGAFYDRFDHVVLLSAPVEVLLERVRRRSGNPYGSTAEQQNEIAVNVRVVEPLLRAGATAELDARRPVGEIADAVESLARG